jgi:Ca2+-binding EF-hand superfamily protein
MPRSIDDILRTHAVTRDEVDALFRRFDSDGSKKLEKNELRELAALLQKRLPRTDAGDLLEIMDFYDVDHDGAMDRDELMTFLKVQLNL